MNAEEQQMLARDRQAVRDFFAGDRVKPLVIERRDAYTIEDVLRPSASQRLGMAFRYILICLGAAVPCCKAKGWIYRLTGMKVGRGVCISPGVTMDPLYPHLIELEDGCLLGMGCRLLTHEYTATKFRAGRVRVGRGAVIGAYAVVRSGVSVGSKATVGAMSFVNRDVPHGAKVGGVPARPLESSCEGDK